MIMMRIRKAIENSQMMMLCVCRVHIYIFVEGENIRFLFLKKKNILAPSHQKANRHHRRPVFLVTFHYYTMFMYNSTKISSIILQLVLLCR